MKSAGADAKGILDYLRRNTGKKTQLRDVHNTLAKINRERRASTSDEQRTETLLREFCLISGNSACMFTNDGTSVIDVVCIQSARQKRLFRAFPEVILVDTTHCTNRNLYKVFSVMVTDVFGKGQYVHHSIFERETEANLLLSIGQFKKENPSWNNVRVIISDKDFNEKEVLAEAFPNARQLLCQFHVIARLRLKVGEVADVTIEKKQAVKASCHLMMKSQNALEYKKYKDTMLRLLGGNTSDPFYKYFQANWELCKDEIECGWGKLKQKVKREYTIDEMLATIIMLQEWSEGSYVKEFTALDTRQTPLQEDAVDPELSTLAVQLSPHAYRIVANQYRFAISDHAQYCIDTSTPGKALLRMEGVEEGERHVVNTQTFQCDCVFMQTLYYHAVM
ncbi:hypothetical protein F441_14035 [Phytophthora nicotianae CJ01A1]|uniref:ZSWIM1/3 RNaseH-like domain-containing protein n=1 Tax=Phytophthora nicotianae CJ01A1 TaxID=1317063 RepID=W2WIV1_PHYNI|nr:hypothetical protein F441_14035 [Phytophthora nicotianae CJ01A1]